MNKIFLASFIVTFCNSYLLAMENARTWKHAQLLNNSGMDLQVRIRGTYDENYRLTYGSNYFLKNGEKVNLKYCAPFKFDLDSLASGAHMGSLKIEELPKQLQIHKIGEKFELLQQTQDLENITFQKVADFMPCKQRFTIANETNQKECLQIDAQYTDGFKKMAMQCAIFSNENLSVNYKTKGLFGTIDSLYCYVDELEKPSVILQIADLRKNKTKIIIKNNPETKEIYLDKLEEKSE